MDPTKYRPRDTFNSTHFTTNSGAPVFNNQNSLSVGSRGPLLLEDYHLLEKLANFDRERIPERVVHARGATAKGFFETTADISNLTCADLFRGVGVKTPVALRFSTVIHSRHSPESLRDPRGFAVKFYTREGNWDMVGNNMPVFFIRDGIKFPDMVHAFKPNPRTENQEPWRILDFLSHHPESCHMLTFLLDDVGIPRSYRQMPGFGVHTFMFFNKSGQPTYVKFHWVPKAGDHALLDDEAEKVGGKDFSHATHDLIEAISRGDYPEWTLCIQTMDPSTENNYDFDPLDVTKTWPESMFPLQPVGRLVLNKNVDNQFLENEQIAFSPALVVPGIYYSDDKLLQSRLFSYTDTQRYRLGANYLQLPINAPKNAHRNHHYDGQLNPMHREGEVNYHPSHFEKLQHAPVYPTPRVTVSGTRTKEPIQKENNFAQAGERYRSFDVARQERFVGRVADWLNSPRVTNELKSIWLGYWSQCDSDLGSKLSKVVKMNSM
uniref:Catalase n=1 Tax=Timspurckia oligopyrenoides TaxID=708627 RepID=A0A7S0ZLG9_9RHOD|mmetsp:Transcript_9728/g.17548  ORF Transcript_9728/g.17548 Transcript_9728/m.17548 type:complete len:492 (+) Transcript_9728:58-1533(+)